MSFTNPKSENHEEFDENYIWDILLKKIKEDWRNIHKTENTKIYHKYFNISEIINLLN